MGRTYELLQNERQQVCKAVVTIGSHIREYDDLDACGSESDVETNVVILIMLCRLLSLRHRELRPSGWATPALIGRFSSNECYEHFRFRAEDLRVLLVELRFPQVFTTGDRGHQKYFPGETALILLLKRLSYPCRYKDLVSMFGLSIPDLAVLFNTAVCHIYQLAAFVVKNLAMWVPEMEDFGIATAMKADIDVTVCSVFVWGFIDGTVRGVCRPRRGQRSVYNGHKRLHSLKYESVSLPNGIIAWLYGPVEGRRHDSFISGLSGIEGQLAGVHQIRREADVLAGQQGGRQYCIYGDPAYNLSANVCVGFKGFMLSEEQALYNKMMSSVRESVEWSFGKIDQYFPFVDYKKNKKILLSPVAKYYIVAAFLTNCHTCCYGSTTSAYFGVQPPTLQNYFARGGLRDMVLQ